MIKLKALIEVVRDKVPHRGGVRGLVAEPRERRGRGAQRIVQGRQGVPRQALAALQKPHGDGGDEGYHRHSHHRGEEQEWQPTTRAARSAAAQRTRTV